MWPREVEEVIAKHPAVAEIPVAGVPDAHTSEAVKADVVVREGQTVTVEKIASSVRSLWSTTRCRSTSSSAVAAEGIHREVLRRQLASNTETLVEQHFIPNNGVRCTWRQVARPGALVILLHGFPEFWYGWRRQIPALAARRVSRVGARPARLQPE